MVEFVLFDKAIYCKIYFINSTLVLILFKQAEWSGEAWIICT